MWIVMTMAEFKAICGRRPPTEDDAYAGDYCIPAGVPKGALYSSDRDAYADMQALNDSTPGEGPHYVLAQIKKVRVQR